MRDGKKDPVIGYLVEAHQLVHFISEMTEDFFDPTTTTEAA